MKSSELVRRCIAAGAALAAGIAFLVMGCGVDRYEYYESIVTVVEDQQRPEAVSLLGRRLLAQSDTKLKEPGIILLELDPEQVPVVLELAGQLLPEAVTSVEQDLAHLDRILVINRGGEEA